MPGETGVRPFRIEVPEEKLAEYLLRLPRQAARGRGLHAAGTTLEAIGT
jgi:hypothetical protein